MGYRIIGAGLAGWAGIVALAWRMADKRIGLCSDLDRDCEIATTASRDFVLTAGLTVALVVIVTAALIWARRTGRLSSFTQANRAHRLPAE